MLARMSLWRDLRLDDPRRRDVASRCFYIGKGVEETRRLLDRASPAEDESLIGLTDQCGYKLELHQIKEVNNAEP